VETLLDELRGFLHSQDLLLPDGFDEETPLVSSGILDSLALVNLTAWVEEKVGTVLDPAAIEIGEHWNTMRAIVAFIQAGGRGSPDSVRSALARVPRRTARQFVPWSPDLLEPIAEFQTGLWSTVVDRNRSYLQWKYLENPYGGEPRIYLLRDGARGIIGMRGFYQSRWEVGRAGETRDLLIADDMLMRADCRNQGMVSELMGQALEDLHQQGVEYVLNLSGGTATVLGSLAMGWRSAGYLGPVRRSRPLYSAAAAGRARLEPLRLLWRFAGARWLHLPRELRPLAGLDRSRGARRVGSVTIEIGDQLRAREMCELVRTLPYDGRIRHQRDERFLSWRYRNPLRTYRFLYAFRAGLEGFLALSWKDNGRPNPTVEIVDWEGTDELVLTTLLETALTAGGFPEVSGWAPQPDSRTRGLEQHGFEASVRDGPRVSPCILVRACDPARPTDSWRLADRPLLDQNSWDMRMLYSMVG